MIAQNEPHRHDWDPEGNCYLCGKSQKTHYEELEKDWKAHIQKLIKNGLERKEVKDSHRGKTSNKIQYSVQG